MKKRAALIFNPAAGSGGDADLGRIVTLLAPSFDLHVLATSRERDAPECAQLALDGRPDLVIASGGDGTVSAVASRLVGTGVPFGIVPRGTASSIAGALGIPSDVDGACAVLLTGATRCVDTARCNGRTMVLLAAVGLHADAVADTDRESKHKWGVLAYVASGIQTLMTFEPFDVEMDIGDQIIRCRASAVTVANMAPTTTVLAQGPDEVRADDGMLDVTVIAASSLAETVAAGLHLLRTAAQGEPATRDSVGYFGVQKVRITTNPPHQVLIDGEEAGTTPLVIECVPQSLHIVVP